MNGAIWGRGNYDEMKEKILNTIYKKLCDGFKTKFLTRGQFEKEFSGQHNSLLESLTLLTQTYFQLKNSGDKQENSQVVKINKDEYIIERFNSGQNSYQPKYTLENLEELKQNYQYEDFAERYDRMFKNEDEKVVAPLTDFIKDKTTTNISFT